MKNIEFIKAHLEKPGITQLAEEAFWTSDKYIDLFDFIIWNLTTKVEKDTCWPINRVAEDVVFDWMNTLFTWWMEDMYYGWYDQLREEQPTLAPYPDYYPGGEP